MVGAWWQVKVAEPVPAAITQTGEGRNQPPQQHQHAPNGQQRSQRREENANAMA